MQEQSTSAPTTSKVMYSPSDLIPESYQNALIQIRDNFRNGYFFIGDIANELCEYAKMSHYRVTQADVFHAVGRYCGKSGRTVRYYAECADFYPPSVRDEFDMCAFSHFVLAKSAGDEWRPIMEYAKENPWISEDGLRIKFFGLPIAYDGQELDPIATVAVGAGDAQVAVAEQAEIKAGDIRGRYNILAKISSLCEEADYLATNFMPQLNEKARPDAERALQSVYNAANTLLYIIDHAA